MSTPYSYSSQLTSLGDILKKKQELKDKKESVSIKKGLKTFVPFKPYATTDPSLLKLNSPESFRQAFEKIPGFKMMPTISALTPGVELPPEFKGGLVVNPLTQGFTTSRVEGTAIAEQGNPELYAPLMYKLREFCRQHYYGTGTMTGLYTRMRKQITSRSTVPLTDEEIKYIRRKFPVSGKPKMSGDGMTVMSISPSFNKDAAAGAPYFRSGVTVEDRIQDVVVRSEYYLTILKEFGASGLNKYFYNDEDPKMHELVVMLCPKADIYERSEYHTKSRPFGVFPGALRLLFSCISTVVKDHLQNAFQNPESMSAMGLSWAHGGAQRLYDLLVSRKKPGYYPLSWGDDQLIVAVAKDGSIILLNPDVVGMDMKLDEPRFKGFKAWLLGLFTDEDISVNILDAVRKIRKIIHTDDLDDKWLSAISFFVYYMNNTPTLTYKQYLFLKTRGLFSGINMTTWIDNIASGTINYHLEKFVPIPDTFNPTTITAYKDKLFKKAEEIGFPFKSETYNIQVLATAGGTHTLPNRYECGKDKLELVKTGEVITLPFLGQTLAQFTFPESETDDGKPMTILVPKSDSVPILAACSLQVPSDKDPEVRFGKMMEGILGRGFNVVTDIHAYLYLKKLWDKHVSMGHRPIISGSTLDVGFEEFDLSELKDVAEYPSIYWFARVFADHDQKKNLTKIQLVKGGKAKAQALQKSFASMLSMDDDDELDSVKVVKVADMPKLYKPATQRALELIQDDLENIVPSELSSATMHNPPVATVKQNREIQPVPSIRAAHEARYKEKFEKIRLLRARYKALSGKVSKGRMTMVHDEDEDEFDDVDNPEYQDEIESYLEDRALLRARHEDEEYEEWEREHMKRQHEREEEKYDDYENSEEYLEDISYDPFAKGDFGNVQVHSSKK